MMMYPSFPAYVMDEQQLKASFVLMPTLHSRDIPSFHKQSYADRDMVV
jgi:hypothetical protein